MLALLLLQQQDSFTFAIVFSSCSACYQRFSYLVFLGFLFFYQTLSRGLSGKGTAGSGDKPLHLRRSVTIF